MVGGEINPPIERMVYMKKLYIAYGSNMDVGQMSRRCPQVELVGKAEITGYELLFKGSQTGAFATIEPKEGGIVPVLIWKIAKQDERSLDWYEGFPTFYYKKDLPFTMNGSKKKGMAYIMDEKRELGIPSDAYYDILYYAYRKFGFDMHILEAALHKCIDGRRKIF